MKNMLALAAAASLSWGAAASTYLVNGIQYVDLEQFARENRMGYQNSYGRITLKAQGTTLVVHTGSKEAQVNGASLLLAQPLANVADTIVAPLGDLQRTFGMKVTATAVPQKPAPAATATSMTPPPMPSTGAASGLIAPNGYFTQGSKQYPKDRVQGKTHVLIPGKGPLEPKSLFTKPDISSPYSSTMLDGEYLAEFCRSMTLDILKSPGSAQFVGKTEVHVYSNKAWLVQGYVDSQNGYGALLRGRYFCFMRLNGKNLEIVSNFFTRK